MNNKEVGFLLNRIKDLASACHLREIPTNTFFLNLYEQTVFHSIVSLPPVKYAVCGGYENAERKIVCFLPYYMDIDNFSPADYISCISIKPANLKFAQALSHRDYLGALMNLGVERHVIGDICIGENAAYVIVLNTVADLLIREISFVKHTKVQAEKVSLSEISNVKQGDIRIANISSNRLDALISSVYNISRNDATKYIAAEKVFINSSAVSSHSKSLSEGDIVSVRGLGRFRFIGKESLTRKGRLKVEIEYFS